MYHLHAPWYYVLQNVSSMIQPVWGREVSTLVDTCIMYVSCMYHLPSKLPEMIHRWYIHDTCINRWYTMIQHDTRWYTRRSVSSLIQRWYRDDTRWYTRIGNDHESDRKVRRSRAGAACLLRARSCPSLRVCPSVPACARVCPSACPPPLPSMIFPLWIQRQTRTRLIWPSPLQCASSERK